MRDSRGVLVALALAGVLGLARACSGGDGSCAQCGCQAACQNVCRLVCEEKKVTITCWGCKCEDFCLPGHSQRGCRHCEEVCAEDGKACDPDAPLAKSKNFVWTEWIPGCARVHTKKKLMKKTITKKVPSHKWVVEELCPECEAKAASVQAALVADGIEVK